MSESICSELWIGVIRKLYEKLSLTRGQITVAAELFAHELFFNQKANSISEAVSHALSVVKLKGDVEVAGNVYRVKIPGYECPLKDLCPLPSFTAASARFLTGRRVYPATGENFISFKDGFCVFELKDLGDVKA
ncbi:MAG: hypothetical protein ABWK01_09010 [Infirmifilum sp.]